MTKIKMLVDGNVYTVTADGHATSSAVVCAGVSAIVFALENWLRMRVNLITKERESVIESGYASISFSGGVEAMTAFEVAIAGFLAIEASHIGEIEVDIQKN